MTNIEDNSVAFYILTRIGLNEPNPEYLLILDKMMELPQF